MEVVDDFTIRLHSPDGLGDIPLILSAWRGGFRMVFTPSEYMKQFHIDYDSDAQKTAAENGFDSWSDYFQNRISDAPLRNTEKPQVEPWKLTQITDTIKVMERNPYFWRVDPEGNQLPYIDRVVIQIVTPDVYQLKVSGGDASIAYYRTSLDNLPLYMAGAETGDYRVALYRSHSTAWMKYFTVGRFHQDPVIRELFSNLDFRRAVVSRSRPRRDQQCHLPGIRRARRSSAAAKCFPSIRTDGGPIGRNTIRISPIDCSTRWDWTSATRKAFGCCPTVAPSTSS